MKVVEVAFDAVCNGVVLVPTSPLVNGAACNEMVFDLSRPPAWTIEPAVERLRLELAPLCTMPWTQMSSLVADEIDTDDGDRALCVTFPSVHCPVGLLTKEMAPPVEPVCDAEKNCTSLVPVLAW